MLFFVVVQLVMFSCCFEQCQVVWTLGELLKRFVGAEYAYYIIRKTNVDENTVFNHGYGNRIVRKNVFLLEDSTFDVIFVECFCLFRMVFASNTGVDFSPLETICELLYFTLNLLRIGLVEERQHSLLLHGGLDFIDTVNLNDYSRKA